MAKHPFLSPEWMDEARKLREKFADDAGAAAGAPMKMNLTLVDVPFGEGTLDAHVDTSGGGTEMEIGHMEGAEVKLTVPYAVAKAIFVEGNQQAGMQAFMAGQIKVDGDMTKLMAMQGGGGGAPGGPAAELQKAIQEITE